MSQSTEQLTIRRYRPGKDGAWYGRHRAVIAADEAAELDVGRAWVAEVGGKPIGICTWQLDENGRGVAEIDRLWLEPDFRHRGIGGALLKRTTSDARRTARKIGSPVREVVITAPHEDAAAVAFLQAMKFDTAATPPARNIGGD
jgi:GNAT superfamily N-acetyltransferase